VSWFYIAKKKLLRSPLLRRISTQMKYVFLIVGVFFCFVIGYLIEPSLRELIRSEVEASEVEDSATEEEPDPAAEEDPFDPFRE